MSLRPLRPHQVAALDGLKASLMAGHRRPMLQAPTGSGKTICAAHIVAGAMAKHKRVAFCVPALSLVDQTFERFQENGISPLDMGIQQADHPWRREFAPVQIATAQTLSRRALPQADVVVIDEAHIRFAVYERWMREHPETVFIGLSATPWSTGLGRLFDDLVKPVTIAELIDAGLLSRFRVFAPSKPDLDGVKTVAGDYHEGQLAERMNQPKLVADIVETWLARGENRPTLCFATGRKHARAIHDQFRSVGVPAAYVDANTPRAEREAIGRALAAGEIKIVCNIGTLTTGIDWDVRCIILARPTQSESLFVQIVGRGLRTADGKPDCLARGTLVLTDRGEVEIQNITLGHKVWDGENFVQHGGAICRGVQRVINYDGLIATPDHEVWTNDGWKRFETAVSGRLRIARTGLGGKPIRLADDYVAHDAGQRLQFACRGAMYALFRAALRTVPQHSQAPWYGCMPALQWSEASAGSGMVVPSLSSAVGALHESKIGILRTVRWAWDRVSFLIGQRGSALGSCKPRRAGSSNAVGSYREQRPLRAWKSSLGDGHRQSEQYARIWWPGAIYRLSQILSLGPLCRQYRCWPATHADVRGDCGALERALVQTEREVWDVLNAGPLQRYTANGRLVHNCVLLDHSDTHQRLGFVTDINCDGLDMGRAAKASSKAREKKPRLPVCCAHCTALMPVLAKACGVCGHALPEPKFEVGEGELVEMRGGKSKPAPDSPKALLIALGKQAVYGQIKALQMERGRSDGWAAHTYRSIFDVWPRGLDGAFAEPGTQLRAWVRHRDIAFSKSRQAEVQHQVVAL